jgi:hypothetical protein
MWEQPGGVPLARDGGLESASNHSLINTDFNSV